MDRIDSAQHYITRLKEIWTAQLAEHTGRPPTGEMLALLCGWEDSSDAETLALPARSVSSRGDAHAIPDDTWCELESELGVNHHNRQRFDAAQRTCALRWLAVLWKQHHQRTEEFSIQLDRVH